MLKVTTRKAPLCHEVLAAPAKLLGRAWCLLPAGQRAATDPPATKSSSRSLLPPQMAVAATAVVATAVVAMAVAVAVATAVVATVAGGEIVWRAARQQCWIEHRILLL